MTKQKVVSTELHQPGWGFLTRAFWMMGGNIILMFSALAIFQRQSGSWGIADGVFWGTVVAMVIVRYLDIQFCKGLTAMGEPATLIHWRKYVLKLVIFSGILWIVVHLLNSQIVHK